MNNRSRPRSLLSRLLVLSALSFASLAHAAESSVFSDTFDYYSWNTAGNGFDAMTDNWSQVGTGGVATIIRTNATYPNLATPYLNLGNRVITSALNQPVTSDFDLTVNALHLTDGRSFWIGLFNESGTQGYGFRWEAYAAGSGSVRVVRFDNATLVYNLTFSATAGSPAMYIDGGGTQIGRPGMPASVTGESSVLLPVGLSWSAEANSLTLTVNGVAKAAIDLGAESFSEFSKVYIGSIGDVAIGDVNVTTSQIPEPAHAASIVAGVSLLAFVGRRAHRNP